MCRRFLGLLVSLLRERLVSSSGPLKWVRLELLGKDYWKHRQLSSVLWTHLTALLKVDFKHLQHVSSSLGKLRKTQNFCRVSLIWMTWLRLEDTGTWRRIHESFRLARALQTRARGRQMCALRDIWFCKICRRCKCLSRKNRTTSNKIQFSELDSL